MSNVISLSGRMGAGKDFIYSQYLFPLGYRKFALADHFKIWIVGRGLATYDEVFITKPEKIRHILQQSGTEEGRNIFGNEIWCQTAFAWIEHLSNTMKIDKWCITDVRFKNEVLAIQKSGGRVIRIIAPLREEAAHPSEEARNHISETDLDDFPIENYNGLLFNDPEYKDTINAQVNHFLGLPPNFTTAIEEHDAEDIPVRKVEDLVTGSVANITGRIGTMMKSLKAPLKNLYDK